MEKIKRLATEIYGEENSVSITKQIECLIEKYRLKVHQDKTLRKLSEKDIALICYADNIKSKHSKSLKVMDQFFRQNLKGILSHLHFLPFYPYTSDDGFAVQDFLSVNEEFGDWNDIEKISEEFQLIFDAVINHISSKHQWVQEYLEGNPKYADYFIEMDKNRDLSTVVRPRDLPLLSKFSKAGEAVWLWTTFSDDQLDINYENPDVLLEVIDVLLFYISKGASIIRLDAIAYLWKKLDSSCINLPETHKMVKIFRHVMEKVKEDAMLLPEANVPSKENLEYLGNGNDEAQLIYQFSISPLVLYTFYSQNSNNLLDYLDQLPVLNNENHFFNVLATHDGIGLRPVRDILNSDEIDLIIDEVKKRNGMISYKGDKDGGKTPYELNITYFDALRYEGNSQMRNIDKFIAAHAILLSIQGLPALYFHSLFGTRNYYEGYAETQQPRTLNRRKFDINELENLLNDSSSHESQVFARMRNLLKIRKSQSAFHPNSPQEVVKLSKKIFSIKRGDEDFVLILINVSDTEEKVILPEKHADSIYRNIIDDGEYNGGSELYLKPYETLWLKR